MMYVRWAFFAPISLAFNLVVMLTAPIWAAWAALADLDELPMPFDWVHTHDETIYGIHVYGPRPATAWGRFTRAIKWLWRNPGYTFDARVLGFPAAGARVIDSMTHGTFDIGGPATRWIVIEAADGRRYFTYRRDIPLWGDRFMKLFVGWQSVNQAGWHIIKITFNPFRTV